jgi:prepilin-type N-terminal cleavage/methylation domain-containing protein
LIERREHRPGFTLVELLIVIVIIGILAAVAVPMFGESSADAKVAALDQNLATVRKAIDMYRAHHDGAYPGKIAVHKVESGVGGPIVLQAHTDFVDAFTKQITLYSNANGDTSAAKDDAYPFGPYLRKGVLANPLPAAGTTSPAAVKVTASSAPLTADANPTTGWKTSYVTGEFIANNAQHQSR